MADRIRSPSYIGPLLYWVFRESSDYGKNIVGQSRSCVSSDYNCEIILARSLSLPNITKFEATRTRENGEVL